MSLNFANNEVCYFNDIYMLSNNGQSSIYDVFYQKDDPTNNIITQEELDTALSTKANTITLNNYMVNTNNAFSNTYTTLPSFLQTTRYEEYYFPSTMGIIAGSYVAKTEASVTFTSYLTKSHYHPGDAVRTNMCPTSFLCRIEIAD